MLLAAINSRFTTLETTVSFIKQGWGQVHWYLYLSTLKYNFAVLVLILKSYISFMDVLVLVLKYYINVLEYLCTYKFIRCDNK